ncbi:DNA-binding transcriptional regulator, XRE-family HTH domain [Jeotgalicoccus aerolatus]|uniref:DNA-binding transcriptional regulator, XRE-family HTH domain n=1 Tax=Jeotgalicoccus aerolatus TaxID=709510 RepID=A0A1G9E5C9_9STAP|nr:helix-turn-helix transcriptional regulator [Jeotgalicoccus aerolatus]SDK71299.1 DNA-binding transcriptional regulator, XRE-family HTH domain [Jeotgalicoccus aerolatus]
MNTNKNKTLIEIGNNIRSLRLSRNLSQEQLAFEVGLHRTYIGAVERGEKNITILNLIKIKNALNVSMSQIYIEREE